MTVHYETDGPVVVITLDRPEVANAIDRPTADALADAFRRFDADASLSVSVLTGANRTFCCGADLKAMRSGDPSRVSRITPDEHVGFGGPGPHFCLGAHLARREMTVMFREIFRRLPDLEITGEPAYLASLFFNGIKHMPCELAPRGMAGRLPPR